MFVFSVLPSNRVELPIIHDPTDHNHRLPQESPHGLHYRQHHIRTRTGKLFLKLAILSDLLIVAVKGTFILALPMLRLLYSKEQGPKDFQKTI